MKYSILAQKKQIELNGTKEDLEKRALKAEEDYKNGHLTSLEDLMKEEW